MRKFNTVEEICTAYPFFTEDIAEYKRVRDIYFGTNSDMPFSEYINAKSEIIFMLNVLKMTPAQKRKIFAEIDG